MTDDPIYHDLADHLGDDPLADRPESGPIRAEDEPPLLVVELPDLAVDDDDGEEQP